ALEDGGDSTMQDRTRAGGGDLSSDLMWVKPKRSRRQFELRAGDTIVATLAWSRGSSALAQWGENQYRFSRQGWLRPRILLRDAGAGDTSEPLATFTQHGGVLSFPEGTAFFWKKPRRLTKERIWADAGGTELVRFRPGRHATEVVVAQVAARGPELPVLALLGQYTLVLAAQDEEAAAATTVAIIAST